MVDIDYGSQIVMAGSGREQMKRLIVGITGATGVIFGIRLLESLKDTNVETHLVLSKWAM